MKKILLYVPMLVMALWACDEEDELVLDVAPTMAFLENELQVAFAFDDEGDSVLSTTIQLIGIPASQDTEVHLSLSASSSARLNEHIVFPEMVEMEQGTNSVALELTLKAGALEKEESIRAIIELSTEAYSVGANVSQLVLNLEKLAEPECTQDFTEYMTSLSVTTGDSYGYSWDWNGATDRTLEQDELIANRLSNRNFYGWEDSQPVFFELSCTSNSVSVIPISGYATPGGYTFDITGGSGTYDDYLKSITVTYDCSHSSDGEFTITETYTRVCGVDVSEYTGPLGIQTGDTFGYSWDWNGATDLTLTVDSEVSNRLVNTNFYGWSNAQPVFFDLSCDDNTVSVVPISGYATGNGFTFDITGGSGTYDDSLKSITVTYECSNETDGNFTISETYN